jgi:hypothetical protein
MLLKNNGNTSMTACERLDEDDISTTRCNEVITCTTPTDKHAHKNNVTTILVSSPSWGWGLDFSPSIENNSFPPLLRQRNHREALEFLTPESDTVVQTCNTQLPPPRWSFGDGGLTSALGKDIFTAKNDATVLVTFAKNVARRFKCIRLFKPRYKMAHKPRYSLSSVWPPRKIIQWRCLFPFLGKGRCYPCAAITQWPFATTHPLNMGVWMLVGGTSSCYVEFRLGNMHELWGRWYGAPNPPLSHLDVVARSRKDLLTLVFR